MNLLLAVTINPLLALALVGVAAIYMLPFASAVASEKIGARIPLKSFDHDPGATTAVICSPDGGTTKRAWDLGALGLEAFGVEVRPTVIGGGGGGVVKVEIVAADDAAMSTHLTVVKDSGTVAADALNDVVFLEALASEVRQLSEELGYALRYVAARITCGHAGDEANVLYVGLNPRFSYSGLTATSIT